MSDDLTINVNGQTLSGWTSVRVTRGIERLPSDFELEVTERYPGKPQAIVIQPGNACTVSIGGNLVLTGYCDQYVIELGPDQHTVRIRGRSKCEDLADTSAGFQSGGPNAVWQGNFPGSQVAIDVIKRIAAPFGVSVIDQTDGLASQQLPPFYINLGETTWEVIERISRYLGFLAYDNVDGNLILAKMGVGRMASGFTEGVYVQRVDALYSMDQRYSDYYAMMQAASLQDTQGSNVTIPGYAHDEGVQQQGRFRPLAFITDYPALQHEFPVQQANWECNRRWGRGNTLKITCDSWRDASSMLWQVNAYVDVKLPTCKVTGPPPVGSGWIISEVTFSLDAQTGTTAEVTVMPDVTFTPEPVIFTPQSVNLSTNPNNVPTTPKTPQQLPVTMNT